MKQPLWIILMVIAAGLLSCSKEDPRPANLPILVLKTGDFTADGALIPVGGKISFGITASTGDAPLTLLRVQRNIGGKKITELDKGFFIEKEGLDYTFNSVKSSAEVEYWSIMVMNANRDSAMITRTVYLGEGSAYGPVQHYTGVRVGMQNNLEYPQFLDLHSGTAYTASTVTCNEALIDFVGFVYLTGGVMSPTLCCPAYTGSSSVTGFYPAIGAWAVRNSTLYDYYSSDNNLVDPAYFDAAQTDSLLVESYRPGNVSGLSKFAYTGKIIPFKTNDGKYGLMKVIHSDQVPEGYMELEIKIQQ
jgi:hypothetical protein